MVDHLYKEFDNVAKTFDLFKVETVGNAYVAVANLVKEQPDDHCKRVAQFAIEAVKSADRILLDIGEASETIVLRIGFNSGPILADVVGHRNPRYALLGDTMNIVSRLARHSGINGIGCVDSTASILRQQWPEVSLVDRGHVSIRGKGMMRGFVIQETLGDLTPEQAVQSMLTGSLDDSVDLEQSHTASTDLEGQSEERPQQEFLSEEV